ncbi:hypothetical protein ACSBR2_024243 [Camellia fascicularis]
MAEKSLLSHILFVLAFCLYLHSALSRSLSSSESEEEHSHSHSHSHSQYHYTTTTVLDVSASIQRTLHLLSFHQQQQQQKSITVPSSSSSSSFSLSLHPRYSLLKTNHKDYKTLTLSRLDRDSARLNFINTKLELALNGVNRSVLKPVATTISDPESLQTPLTSGASQGSGEYFARVGVGSPATQYYMVVDTGSDISWLQCRPCTDCYQQSDSIFDPSGSSSYRSISCGSAQCSALEVSACRTDSCLYQVSYGDGSFTVGDLATEKLSFGNSGSVNNVAIGCGHDNEGLFIASAGLLGLGGGTLSLTSQLKASSFSYCLVDRDSTGSSSTLEFNSATPGDSVTAPLLRNSQIRTYRYVALTGMSVGGQPLALPPSVFDVDATGRGGVIVDSGTAVTRLKTQVYNSLRDSFVKMTQNLPSTSGFSIFDTCYDLSSKQTVSIPTVSFHFSGGETLRLRPQNYLIPVDSAGKFCFAFAPADGSLSIIGNIQQQGTRVSYDLANSLVAFSPNKC